MTSWESKYRELEASYAALERSAAEEKAKARIDFHDWKSATTTRHDAEKIALAIQFDQKLKEADVLADIRIQEATEVFAKEKDELILEHQRQQSEREASFDRMRADLEIKLDIAQREREEALKHEQESRDVWLAERDTLVEAHREDNENLKNGWDEQRLLLEAQYKKAKDESEKAWTELHADAIRKAEEERARVEQLELEKEELLKKYNELRAENQKEKELIKSVTTNLEFEKSRLEKLMECYGDITEIKSKGDTYYSVSFSQLQRQIIDLATTHFVHLPVRPPTEDLAQVPKNLPSFLGDTKASRQVRATYIAHMVSKLITYRVFSPFLFSLGRRYDKADSLFLSMSSHIRDKSTRKESIWRQQTLLAAFTSSGAKQRINTAAGTVVEEIVNAIKHFADPKEEEGIKIAVKRIVKLAAETWRFARLEREMITATMPTLEDEEHRFKSPEFWPAYISDSTTASSSDAQPKLLLRLFPVIYRESKHDNFPNDVEQADEGCIYHYGLALYDDAESVVRRAEELKSAGLPSFTTTSPTIAERGKFPPPMIPPPRGAPPPLPPKAENLMSRSSGSKFPPPLTPSEISGKARRITPPSARSLNKNLDPSTPPSRVLAYQRPPPAPIDFPTPRNIIGLPVPVESMFTSNHANSMNASAALRARTPILPLSATELAEDSTQPAPTESATFSESFYELSVQESGSKDPPTPPHSCSSTPTRPASPLFETADETNAPQTHRHRPTISSRRRSSHIRHRSEDEISPINHHSEHVEIKRRSTGFSHSHRTSKLIDSERSERSERSNKSHFMYEGRSAAIKALYPNNPITGQSEKNSRDSGKNERSSRDPVKSSKRKDRDSKEMRREKSAPSVPVSIPEMWQTRMLSSIPDNGTWDTNSVITGNPTSTFLSTKRRERNIPDTATWDTASVITGDPTGTLLSTKGRPRSIPDNGTWDTASVVTGDPTGTYLSTRRREGNIPDTATWDTASVITDDPTDTLLSFKHRERSILDNGTWDTASVITDDPTSTYLSMKHRERNIPDTATWDTASVVTDDPTDTLLSTKGRPRSIPDNGTWDTASVVTDDPTGTYLSTKERPRSIPDNGTWDTASVVTDDPTGNFFTTTRRPRSIPDNATWDTSSFVTNEPTNREY